METIRLHIPADSVPERLDRLIVRHRPDLSRRRVRRLIDQGAVYLNHRRVRKAGQQVFPPVTIQIFIEEHLEIEKIADQIHWNTLVLYRDTDLLAVNKPAGIPTAPTIDSFVHNVYFFLQQAQILPASYFPFHRLDKDTSGVLLIPLSRRMARFLNQEMQQRQIYKKYLAICAGIPKKAEWSLSGSISRQRNRQNRYRFSPRSLPGGKSSETRFRLLARQPDANLSLIQAEPLSGRTHQIRLHLAYAQLPILGDTRYGRYGIRGWPENLPRPERLLLHCREMSLYQPFLKSRLTIRAPFSDDFQFYLRTLFNELPDN